MLWKSPLIEVGRAAAADTPGYFPLGCKSLGRVGGVKHFRLGLKCLTPHALPNTIQEAKSIWKHGEMLSQQGI